jgi:hypothetical protein
LAFANVEVCCSNPPTLPDAFQLRAHHFVFPESEFVFLRHAGTIHAVKPACGHYYGTYQRGDIFNRLKNGQLNLKKPMISGSAFEQ